MTSNLSYADVLNGVNTAYLRSTSAQELKKNITSLENLLKKKDLSDENRDSGEALKLRLTAKYMALKYVQSPTAAGYDELSSYLDGGLETSREKGWKKTCDALGTALKLIREIEDMRVRCDELRALASGATEQETCLKAKAAALAIAKGADKDSLGVNPFGKAAFIDCTQGIKKLCDDVAKAADAARLNVLASLLDGKYKDISGYSVYGYYPVQEYDEGGKANVLVVSTPFADEARLFAAHNGGNGKVYEVKAETLECGDIKLVDGLFAYAETARAEVVILSAEQLAPYKFSRVLKRAVRLGKEGLKTYIVDGNGNGGLYSSALRLAEESPEMTALDVSCTYLSMPPFTEALDELGRLGALTEADADLLKGAPFMGFMGLCRAVKAFAAGDINWIKEAEKLSESNKRAALGYLARVKSAYLFIDSGWGDYSVKTTSDDYICGGYDYDGLDGIDADNVREIMESGGSVFAKCGALARYCTTGGGDFSAWAYADIEEMQTRVALATRLVFRALRVEIVPQVEVLENIPNATAGGTCYDGGKRVVFKYSCAKNYGWLLGAIVHESFHAMQAKLTGGGWSQWYYDNLGITRGRVEQWRLTMKEKYDGNTGSDIYKVHMYEGDARAFETDCDDGRNQIWNTLNFK